MLITSGSSWANLSCFSWLRAARPRKRWEHNSPQFKTGKREANRCPIASWDRNHSTNERTPFTMCLPSLPRQWAAQCKQTVCRQTKSQYHKNHTFWMPASSWHLIFGTPQVISHLGRQGTKSGPPLFCRKMAFYAPLTCCHYDSSQFAHFFGW